MKHEALQDRVVEYIPRLRRYARALLRGDPLAADDLVQDCLERALSRLHYWRQGSDLRAWLFTIMHNVFVNQQRRINHGPQFVDLPETDPIDTSHNAAESSVVMDEVEQALGQLSSQQREIILLVTLEGMRYQEVAAILDIPEGTVMSRLSRARKQLRQVLFHPPQPALRRVK